MSKILFILFSFISLSISAQKKYDITVETALNATESNRRELEKAIDYFYKTNDSLKIKSINFLIANMPVHFSQSYYWADSSNKKVNVNESDYDAYNQYVAAIEDAKIKYGKIHTVAFSYRDVDSITADYLIENVELAIVQYKALQSSSLVKVKEADFLEYILPYRTSVEPLQRWRKAYAKQFANINTDTAILNLGQNLKQWFTNTYKVQQRTDPLPRLGALQLLTRAKGPCEDVADLTTFISRSQGYASAVDYIPEWATASGRHWLNYLCINPNLKNHYDATEGIIVDTLSREPSKVLRTTYSKQPETIASILNGDTSLIPNNFLRTYNYKDVTDEYWATADITTSLFKLKNITPKVTYACVWNYAQWQPVWYGLNNQDNVKFTNLAKGAVYLPMYYINKKFTAAAYPIISNYDNSKIILKPDTIHKRTIIIENQPGYLIFREGKKYSLYYWNYGWIKAAVKMATTFFTKLEFNNIPQNTLLLLVPEYSEGKERPFIIDSNGKRFWY